MNQDNKVTVLLIDDDLAINYYHNRLFSKIELIESIVTAKNGKEGIDTINECIKNKTNDDIIYIFLDINMPIMNGWEFLVEFDKIKNTIPFTYKIYILSSSINKDDSDKAESNPLVTKFLNKPLLMEHISKFN